MMRAVRGMEMGQYPTKQNDKMFNDIVKFYHEYANASPERKLEIIIANPSDFIGQLKWADVIFIRGGENEPLFKELRKHKGWEKELKNKTLAGTSAGANAISKYYYGLGEGGVVGEGLGLLPLKVIVHYRSDYNAPNIDWDKVDTVMEEYEENLDTVKLREGEFQVFR